MTYLPSQSSHALSNDLDFEDLDYLGLEDGSSSEHVGPSMVSSIALQSVKETVSSKENATSTTVAATQKISNNASQKRVLFVSTTSSLKKKKRLDPFAVMNVNNSSLQELGGTESKI
jgi:hypothetical protein